MTEFIPDPRSPADPNQSPEALQQGKQRYLIEQSIKQALRHLYGDQAVNTTRRIAADLAVELVKRGVMIVPCLLALAA